MNNKKPHDKQIGGDHYSRLPIQPRRFIKALKLDFDEGNVIKLVSRYKLKNSDPLLQIQDLQKAKQYLDFMIEDIMIEHENKMRSRPIIIFIQPIFTLLQSIYDFLTSLVGKISNKDKS